MQWSDKNLGLHAGKRGRCTQCLCDRRLDDSRLCRSCWDNLNPKEEVTSSFTKGLCDIIAKCMKHLGENCRCTTIHDETILCAHCNLLHEIDQDLSALQERNKS